MVNERLKYREDILIGKAQQTMMENKISQVETVFSTINGLLLINRIPSAWTWHVTTTPEVTDGFYTSTFIYSCHGFALFFLHPEMSQQSGARLSCEIWENPQLSLFFHPGLNPIRVFLSVQCFLFHFVLPPKHFLKSTHMYLY